MDALRRPGRVTELLLLYELATRPQGRLRPMAKTLGISVQAVSYLQRNLARRGWVEFADGTYHPTLAGVAALHASISSLQDDLVRRSEHLRLIRRCRAVAQTRLERGELVSLKIDRGILHARRGRAGPSLGRVVEGAGAGELVEVSDLRGILPMTPAPVHCWLVPESPPKAREVIRHVQRALRALGPSLVAAEGLESYHLLRRLVPGEVARFGVAAALREASQLGVPSLVVVTPDRAPTLLRKLAEPAPGVPVQVRSFGV